MQPFDCFCPYLGDFGLMPLATSSRPWSMGRECSVPGVLFSSTQLGQLHVFARDEDVMSILNTHFLPMFYLDF